ncbi:YihY/virulence factor BrkB family protein [Nitrospirota bacterium]
MLGYNVLSASLRDFLKDRGVIYAAALSYFVIVALVPICLFMLSLFGMAIGNNQEFYNFLLGRLMSLFPAITESIAGELKSLITFQGIASTSLVLYAILSYQLYSGLHKSMEAIFKVHTKRSLLEMMLLPLVLITLVMVLLFSSFAMTSSVKLYQILSTVEALDNFIPKFHIGRSLSFAIQYALPLLIMAFAVIILYMVLPKKRIYFDDAFWGGLFTAFMIEGAKHMFTWYVGSVSRLGTIYGSLSTFIFFLIWVYYCSAIFLLGAEIVHNLDLKRKWKGKDPSILKKFRKTS